MPSFDIVSKVDAQVLDNVINVAKRDILNRFDFRDSKSEIDLDKKAMVIHLHSENDMRIEAMEDAIRSRMIKQNLDPMSLDFGKERVASGNMLKKDIKVKQGIEKETSKKIVKAIKDSKLKVDAQIMDDQVRVTAKKIDDLQAIIALCRRTDFEAPLQFVNMK